LVSFAVKIFTVPRNLPVNDLHLTRNQDQEITWRAPGIRVYLNPGTPEWPRARRTVTHEKPFSLIAANGKRHNGKWKSAVLTANGSIAVRRRHHLATDGDRGFSKTLGRRRQNG
jgi:hypothetical protein